MSAAHAREGREADPFALQLLQVGLGGTDNLEVLEYRVEGDDQPCYLIAPSAKGPEGLDVASAVEETLGWLLDNGGGASMVRASLGLLPPGSTRPDGSVVTSRGWATNGRVVSVTNLRPEFDARLSELQRRRIEEAFEVLPPRERLGKAFDIGTDPSLGEDLAGDDLLLGQWRVHVVEPGGAAARSYPWAYRGQDPLAELWRIGDFDRLHLEGTYVTSWELKTASLPQEALDVLGPDEREAVSSWLEETLAAREHEERQEANEPLQAPLPEARRGSAVLEDVALER